jgi:hypothetical protein
MLKLPQLGGYLSRAGGRGFICVDRTGRLDMKKIAIALLMTTLLAVPAFAQQQGPPTARTEGEKKRDAEIDRAYRDAVKRSNAALGKPVKADPWGDVRATDNVKTDTSKK